MMDFAAAERTTVSHEPMLQLIVHKTSLKYVRRTVAWLHGKVVEANRLLAVHRDRERFSGSWREDVQVVSNLADIDAEPGSINLVIGDPFPGFERRSGCRYVFVNFSLLYHLDPEQPLDAEASRWIERKHRAMLARASAYDLILDFLPEQTPLLASDLGPLGVPVVPYLINVAVNGSHREQGQPKIWDLCVVGSNTPRRAQVYAQLSELGLTLSPLDSEDLADTMRNSRVVLNVHAYDCLTCEYPRIIEAMKLGSCLLTEPCIGIDKLLPDKSYVASEYLRIPDMARSLVGDASRRRFVGEQAKFAVERSYRSASDRAWDRVFRELTGLHVPAR